MTESDRLISKAQAGDRSALEQILTPLQSPVALFLKRFVDENDAHDIAQETFIQVVRKIKQFQNKSNFKAWIFRIAYRQMLNHQKSKANRRAASIHEQEVLTPGLGQEEIAEQKERTDILLRIIDSLPEHQRQVIWFRIREQLTFKEIAEICELPLNTILSRMHQAKQFLVKKLKAAGIEMGVVS